MPSVVILVSVAVVLRAAAASVREGRTARVVRVVLCTGFAWLVAGTAGAWAPIWIPIITAGVVQGLGRWTTSRAVISIVECAVVLMCAAASIPALSPGSALVAAAAAGVAGALIDAGVGAVALRLTSAGACAITAMALVASAAPKMGDPAVRWHLLASLPYLGVLTNGAAKTWPSGDPSGAWVEYPRGSPPFPAAILFHGARRAGARDASAALLRHALLDAGFAVCSLDHPGFGVAPAPVRGAPVDAWDPLPPVMVAVGRLRADPLVAGLIAVGHSMGADDALRLARADPVLGAVVLLGAGADTADSSQSIDVERFNRDRRLAPPLSEAEVRTIVERFYDTSLMARSLASTHPPVLIIEMQDDYPDVLAGGRRLFDSISGAKNLWQLSGSAHDLNAYTSALGIPIGDTRIARSLAARLREVREQALKQGGLKK